MTKIGIVTGAAGGIGKAYVRRMMQEDLDEIWCMDRTLDLLKGFKEEFGEKAVTIGADLSSYEDLTGLKSMIEEKKTGDSLFGQLCRNGTVPIDRGCMF